MKRLLCILLTALLIIPTFMTIASIADTKSVSFKDVDGNTSQGKAIEKLASAGVLLGYPDGTFRPNDAITRGELCKIVNLIFNYTDADAEMFSDVDKSRDWYYSHVAIAKKAGYIKGYEDGTFRGENKITREETCTILTRVGGIYDLGITLPIKDEVSEWAMPYVQMVVTSGFMPIEAGETFRAKQNITRGEFAEAFAKFVQAKPEPPKDDEKPSAGNTGTSTGSGNGSSTGSGNSSSSGNKPSSGNTSSKDDEEDNDMEVIVPIDPVEPEEPEEPEEPIDYTELNKSVVENLELAKADLENFDPIPGNEENLINVAIVALETVLENSSEAEINKQYVANLCANEIAEARDIWDNRMTADEKKLFMTDSVPYFNTATIDWLMNFFNIAMPEV